YSLTDGTGNVFRTVSLSVFDLHISSSGTLPNAQLNVPYLAPINVGGGTAPYHFDPSSGLPPGPAPDPPPVITAAPRRRRSWGVSPSKSLSPTTTMSPSRS